MIDFLQLNMKKSFVAAVELNKNLADTENFVCLITEPYRNGNKIAAIPPNSRVICKTGNTRAAILVRTTIECLVLKKFLQRGLRGRNIKNSRSSNCNC